MNACRVCASRDIRHVFSFPPPSLTSTTGALPVGTDVAVCDACGHAQSGDLPDIDAFYGSEYRISLGSDDFDQIVTGPSGSPIYRTELQAKVAIERLALAAGDRILDFGAAKATTLKRILALRPDLNGFVFDVSDDYRLAWQGWVDETNCATHTIPATWDGSFTAVTAHYVLEHVTDPVAVMRKLRGLLAPGGRLLVSVPDVLSNPGDLIVVDHLSHFTCNSMARALTMAGFTDISIDRDGALPGAILCIASCATSSTPLADQATANVPQLDAIAAFWTGARQRMAARGQEMRGRPSAIFGAGFYGAWIATTLGAEAGVLCFADNNVHLQSTELFGLPIVKPADLPRAVEVVYVGLNPERARDIVARSDMLDGGRRELVWI